MELVHFCEDFGPEHWLTAQVNLVAAELALTRVAQGYEMPMTEKEITGSARKFTTVALDLLPEVRHALERIAHDIFTLLADMRAGHLQRRLSLLSGTSCVLGECFEDMRRNLYEEN